MKRRTKNMKQYIKYMMTLAALLTVSMGSWGALKVKYGEVSNVTIAVASTVNGEYTTLSETVDKTFDAAGTVYLKVTPDDGYCITKNDIILWQAYDGTADVRTRSPQAVTITVDGTETANVNAERIYSFTLPVGYDVIVDAEGHEPIDISTGYTVTVTPKTYTGELQTADEIVVTKTSDSSVLSTNYYDVTTNAGGTDVAATYTVTVTGKNGYKGTASGDFAITQAAGSLSFAKASVAKVYGDPAFVNQLTQTGDGTVAYTSGDAAVATVDATGKVTIAGPGKTTITATVSGNTNYAYASPTATFIVNALDPDDPNNSITDPTDPNYVMKGMEVAAEPVDVEYDGSGHSITVTAKDAAGNDIDSPAITYKETATGDYAATNPSKTDIGTYTIYYKVEKTGYDTVEGSTTLTVTNKVGTISFAKSNVGASTTGAAPTNTLTNTGDGNVTYSSTNPAVATVNATTGALTLVADGECEIIATVTNGVNYKYAEKTASYTLGVYTPGVSEAVMSVSSSGSSGEYNGNAHTITVTPDETGTTITYSSDGTNYGVHPDCTDVGTYTVYYKVEKDGFKTVTGSETVIITPKTVTLTWSPTLTFVYNGSPQAPTVSSDVAGIDVTVAGAETDAGNYFATATGLSGTGAANYQLPTTGLSVEFTITAKTVATDKLEVTVPASITTSQTLAVTVKDNSTEPATTLNAGTDYVLEYYKNDNTPLGTTAPTTAGSYKVKIKPAPGSNYNFTPVEKTFTVTNPAPTVYYYSIDVTQPEHGTVSMDNNETYGAAGYTYNVTATADEGYYVESITVNGTAIEGNSFTMPYESVTVSAIIKAKTNIADATVTLDWTEKTYNGQTQKAVVSSVTVGETTLGADDYTVTYAEEAWKNAGEYTITVAAAAGKNTIMGSKTVTFTIAKVVLTVTADDKTMDQGSELPTLTVSYSGFVNNETESVLTTKPTASTTATKDSEAGTYDITVSGGAADNYSFSYVKGKLTIKVKTPKTGDEISIQDSDSGTQISGKVTGSETDSETGKTIYELTLTDLPESVLNGTTSLADDDMQVEYQGNTYQVKKVEADAFEGQTPGVIIFLPDGVSTTAPVTNVVNGDGTSTELNLNNVTSFVAPKTVHADKVTCCRRDIPHGRLRRVPTVWQSSRPEAVR